MNIEIVELQKKLTALVNVIETQGHLIKLISILLKTISERMDGFEQKKLVDNEKVEN